MTMTLPAEFTYQRYAREKIVRLKRTGLLSVPGSGKTRPIIDALVELGMIEPLAEHFENRYPLGPILIACSGPAIATWLRQLPEWTNTPELKDDITIVRGNKHKRMIMWSAAETSGRGIYLINYSILLRDAEVIKQIPWVAIIADEYHKCMRRKKKNKTYAAFQQMTRHTEVLVLASGSSLRKDPSSMFTLFQLVKPKLFRSYWKFVNTYCIVQEGYYGKEILGPRNVGQFKKIMDRYLAYIPKEVVADQLPEGRRMPLVAEMTRTQGKLYGALAKDMVAWLESGEIIALPNVLTKILKLRQLLCCPKILDTSLDMGGGFETIVDRVEEDPHCVIFVPFRPACNYVVDELHKRGHKHVYMIRGGITTEQQTWDVNAFKQMRGILVCTIAYAESFDLETCKTSYFLGYDYSLDINEQAEGRTRRAISQHDFVTWHYIKYLDTIDQKFLAELDSDAINVNRVLTRPKELIAALKGE